MIFVWRHLGIGTNINTVKHMLRKVGVNKTKDLIDQTNIKKNFKNKYIQNDTELKCQENLKNILKQNKPHRSFIGLGYYNNTTPAPIKRHIVENAQWYTSYTPYQAEILSCRLESQYNFQELVKSLTHLPLANASLLDEASAAGESLNLAFAYYRRKRDNFIVADDLHPQILDVLETRSKILGVNMIVNDLSKKDKYFNELSSFGEDIDYDRVCNIMFAYPNTYGDIFIPENHIKFAKDNNILTTGIVDLLALTKLISPGELGLDIALGSSQRLGIPMWYGGPHPAFFAKRFIYLSNSVSV